MNTDSDGEVAGELAAQFSVAGDKLADAIVCALPSWVRSCVDGFDLTESVGQGSLETLIATAGSDATAALELPLRELLTAPIDDQRSTPLALVRTAVRFPTAILASAGVPPVDRDPFEARAFPDDVYGITPATWGDLGPEVAEAGLRWSVNKAFLHRRLHHDPHRS